MATTPEQSDYTSVQERIEHPDSDYLAAFSEQGNDTLPFNLKDYLELVDWGGREVKRNKPGYIPASAPPILVRLKMNASPLRFWRVSYLHIVYLIIPHVPFLLCSCFRASDELRL